MKSERIIKKLSLFFLLFAIGIIIVGCGDNDDNTPFSETTWYRDTDGDGFGSSNESILSIDQPDGYVVDSTDCDDSDSDVYPGAMEISDGVDNDCDDMTDEKDDYLIISPDSLYNSALKLKQYREDTGHKVYLIRLSQISSEDLPTAEEIDSWIEDYYSINSSLKFIVLIGDVSMLPSFSSFCPVAEMEFYSDLKYGVNNQTFETYYIPELFVGRISAKESLELEAYIDKIKIFERNFRDLNTIVFFGATSGTAERRDAPLAESLGYDIKILDSPSEDQIFSILNNSPVAMVFFYGHGNSYRNYPISQDNLFRWNNENYPVLYFSGGCSFNDNTIPDHAFGDSLLFSEGGSAASIGASIAGGYGYDYQFIVEILNLSIDTPTVGELYIGALQSYYEFVLAAGRDVSLGSWHYYFVERMTIKGDPALRLK